jgi:hypothetical protein
MMSAAFRSTHKAYLGGTMFAIPATCVPYQNCTSFVYDHFGGSTMKEAEIIREVRANPPVDQTEAAQRFGLSNLLHHVRDAGAEFERHQKKRCIRGHVQDREGMPWDVLYWQSNLRITMAVRSGDGWRGLFCRCL